MLSVTLHLLPLFIILVLLYLVYVKNLRCKRISENLVKILEKNADFLVSFQRKQDIIQLKHTIKIYTILQYVLKISEGDFISFFKYDPSRKYKILHFIVSIQKDGSIIENSMLENLPSTANLVALNVVKSDDNDLYSKPTSEIKEENDIIYQILKYRGINKIYYHNFKHGEDPLGFIIISYKDENFTISDENKEHVLKSIEKLKTYL